MIKSLKSFVANESGATAIEYALIASLIAVFIIGALSALGTKLSSGSPKSAPRSSKPAKANGFSSAGGAASPAFLLPASGRDARVARETRIGDCIKGSRSAPSLQSRGVSA